MSALTTYIWGFRRIEVWQYKWKKLLKGCLDGFKLLRTTLEHPYIALGERGWWHVPGKVKFSMIKSGGTLARVKKCFHHTVRGLNPSLGEGYSNTCYIFFLNMVTYFKARNSKKEYVKALNQELFCSALLLLPAALNTYANSSICLPHIPAGSALPGQGESPSLRDGLHNVWP